MPRVGGIRGQQAGGQADDLVDVAVCPGLMPDGLHVQRGHIPVEVVLLDGRERVVRFLGTVCRLVRDVIDVGDVPADLGFHP